MCSCRLLGLGIDDQALLFDYYTDTLDATIAQLKSEVRRPAVQLQPALQALSSMLGAPLGLLCPTKKLAQRGSS